MGDYTGFGRERCSQEFQRYKARDLKCPHTAKKIFFSSLHSVYSGKIISLVFTKEKHLRLKGFGRSNASYT